MRPLKILWILILLLSVSAFPQVQSNAELINKINSSKDTAKIEALINYGRWWEGYNLDSSASYYLKAGQLSEKLNFFKGQLKFYANYTYILNQQGKLDSSLRLNLRALDLAKKNESEKDVAYCMFNIGSNYNNLGNYDKALDYYLQSVKLLEKLNITRDLTMAYDNIGGVFTNSGQYTKALMYHKKALDNARKMNDSSDLAKTLINKGITESFINQYAEAEKSVKEGLLISRNINNSYLESIALNTIADIYIKNGNSSNALAYSLNALDIARKIDSKYCEIEALKTLSSAYVEIKNFDSSIHYSQKAVVYSNLYKFKTGVYKLYDILSQAYSGKKDFQNALIALQFSQRIKDSLNKIEVEKKMQQLESDYKTYKTENQILELEKEKKQQQLLIISLIAILLAGLLIGLLVYRNIKNKKHIAEQNAFSKQNEILQLQKEQQLLAASYILKGQGDERSRLAKDLHDGLGGLLSGIKFTLVNDSENISPEKNKALQQLDNAIIEMRRIAHSMMPESLVSFGLTDALKDFCSSFSDKDHLKIHLQAFGLKSRFDQNTEIAIYRIVQELVNNAVKHSQASEIFVQLVQQEKDLTITVEDNGKGFNTSDINTLKGMGLKNVYSRVEYLKGKIEIQSENNLGTTINIEFKIHSNE